MHFSAMALREVFNESIAIHHRSGMTYRTGFHTTFRRVGNLFYKKFIIPNNRKYVNKKHNWQLLDKFESPFIGFSNSYFKNNTFGESSLEPIKEWNYVLFWNKVTRLIPL